MFGDYLFDKIYKQLNYQQSTQIYNNSNINNTKYVFQTNIKYIITYTLH